MAATVTHTKEAITSFQLHEGGKFPTTRRLELWDLSSEPDDIMDEWFSGLQITIEEVADTPERI